MNLNSVQSNDPVFDALNVCCQKIIEKMGNKPISDWRVADYNSLSSQLGMQTGVYLSENTLKRIFGRLKTSQRYFPQKATRDALAQFVGYRDWQEFELVYISTKNSQQLPAVNDQTPIPEVPKEKEKKSPSKLFISALILLLFVAGITIYWIREQKTAGVQLVCENSFGKVPHTAVFKLTSDKFLDKNKEFLLDCMEEALPATITANKKITRFFKNPGVVYVTLMHENKPVDTVSVYMETKGWVANSGNDTSRAYPIAGLKALDPKNIAVSEAQLDSAGLDTKKPFLIGYSNIHASNISGDNFSFSTKVIAEQSRPGAQCIETTVIILGEKDRHLITLFRESCVALSRYAFSDVKVTGADQFLGNLAFNPQQGGDIMLKAENKVISVILNGKKVLSVKYTQSIGKIMGIKILFSGIGKAISPEVYDLNTKEVF